MPVTYADQARAPLETEWTWRGRLPRGAVVLVAGWRQSAKGLLCCNIAAAVTKGTPLPGETGRRPPGDVVMVAAEDDPQEDMAWRLRAAGADLGRVHDMTEIGGEPFGLSALATKPGNTPELLAFIRDLARTCVNGHTGDPWRGHCRECGMGVRNPRLVILDPLNALIAYGSIKTDQGARRVISRLQYVAKRTGVTILVIHHFVKSTREIGGSTGLVDAPRWVYTIQGDTDSPGCKVLHLEKHNGPGATDLRYRIVEDGHDSRIEWVDGGELEREEMSWRTRDKAAVMAAQPPRPRADSWPHVTSRPAPVAVPDASTVPLPAPVGPQMAAAGSISDRKAARLVAAGGDVRKRPRWRIGKG